MGQIRLECSAARVGERAYGNLCRLYFASESRAGLGKVPVRGLAPDGAAPADRAGARHGPAGGGDLEDDVASGRCVGLDGRAALLIGAAQQYCRSDVGVECKCALWVDAET